MMKIQFKNYFLQETAPQSTETSTSSYVTYSKDEAKQALDKLMGVSYRLDRSKNRWYVLLKNSFKLFPLSIPTMGVVHVKSKTSPVLGIIYYGPHFVLKTSLDVLEGVLIHEMLHILTGTHLRKADGDVDRDHSIWNIATDYYINWMIKRYNEADIGTNCLFPDDDGIIRSVMISDHDVYKLPKDKWLDMKVHDAESLYENIIKWDKEILDKLAQWRDKHGDIHYTQPSPSDDEGTGLPTEKEPQDQSGGVVYDKKSGKYGQIISDDLNDSFKIQLYEKAMYNTSLSRLFESLSSIIKDENEELDNEPEETEEDELNPKPFNDIELPQNKPKQKDPPVKHAVSGHLDNKQPTLIVDRKLGEFDLIVGPKPCFKCGQLPCACTCPNCGRKEKQCTCVCPKCKRRKIACNCKCPTCNKKPCVCPCIDCKKYPCECTCSKCNQRPCVCPCPLCKKYPCVCPCTICHKHPCECTNKIDPRFRPVQSKVNVYNPGDRIIDRGTGKFGTVVGATDIDQDDNQLLDLEWDEESVTEAVSYAVPSASVIPAPVPQMPDDGDDGDGDDGDDDGDDGDDDGEEEKEDLPHDQDEQPIVTPSAEDVRQGTAKIQQAARDAANTARLEIERGRGTGSSGDLINAVVDRLFTATIPWQSVLREFIKVKKPIDYDWWPANKSFSTGVYEPKEIKEEEKLVYLIAVDTSGSVMADDTYKLFLSEILNIFRRDVHAKGIVMFWHSEVDANLIKIDSKNVIALLKAKVPTGGTKMSCVANYLKQFKVSNRLGGIIYFTDGDTEANPEFIHKYRGHPIKNLIVLIPGAAEQEGYKKNGRVIRIKQTKNTK